MKSLLVRTAVRECLTGAAIAALSVAPGIAMADQAASAAAQSQAGVEEVVVESVRFRYNEAESALKIPLELKDTPQSVAVVTEDLMEFATIRQFSDIYKIDASGGTAHSGDQVPRNYYRGFRQQSNNSIKVDGFRMTGRTNLDMALFERFEVVKGATSTLYGQNSIGGTLNAISKMPESTPGGEVSVEVGSYQHYRGDVDFHGPLNQDGSISYRLVGAYLDEDNALDFAYNKRLVIAPSVKFELSPDTSILARVSYQKSEFPFYFGYNVQFLGDDLSDPAQIIPANFRIPDVPRSRTGAMPWNKTERSALFALTTLEHRFADTWHLRANVQYNKLTEFHNSGNLTLTHADGSTDISLYEYDDDDKVYAGEVNLYGDVEMFGREHTLFFGVDYATLDSGSGLASDYLTGADLPGGPFSIFNPNYALIPARHVKTDYPSFFQRSEKTEQSGLTVQALLHPTDALTVVLGGRYSRDVSKEASVCCGYYDTLGPEEKTTYDEFTSQAGITYAITDKTNVYVSYGETFEPQSGRTFDPNDPTGLGKLIDPQMGKAYEIGAKGSLFDSLLSWSVAAFDMRRTNISQGDLDHRGYAIASGTQRSRGVELNFQGDFKNGWNIYGSFSGMKAEYTKGQYKGSQPVNAPKFGASVYFSYEFLDGTLEGLGFGGGVVHKAGFADKVAYPYYATGPGVAAIGLIKDFTEVDVRAFYRWNDWMFNIGITNLFDTEYFVQHQDGLAQPYLINPRRSIIGKITRKF